MVQKISVVGLVLAGLITFGLSYWPVPYQEVSLMVRSVASSSVSERAVRLHLPQELPVGEMVLIEMNLPAAEKVPSGAVFLEGRLELPGVSVMPGEVVLAPDRSALPVNFRWLVTAAPAPSLSGTLWLTEILKSADGSEERVALLARPLEFERRSLLGLGLPDARWLGGALAAAGMALALFRRMWK